LRLTVVTIAVGSSFVIQGFCIIEGYHASVF